jgi:hypothetical protein
MFFCNRELRRLRQEVAALRLEMHQGFYILAKGERIMSAELDALTAQVQANTEVEASAVTLIQGLAAQIAANTTDPAALTALSEQLKTSADALAAAITANTPASPASAPTAPPA